MNDTFSVTVKHGPEGLVKIVKVPMEYACINCHTLDALLRYMLWGDKRFSEFLKMCLTNNLQGAFTCWDGENWHAFHAVVKFIYNRLPMAAWGTDRKIRAWQGTFYAKAVQIEDIPECTDVLK